MNGSPTLQNTLNPWRVLSLGIFLIAVFSIYLVRLFSLQVIEESDWSAQADENRTMIINQAAPRGIIYDRNGVILARNIASYNIVIVPADLPADRGELQAIFRELSPLIDLPVNQGELTPENPYVPCRSNHGITQIVEFGDSWAPYQPVKVKCDVDQKMAMVVQEKSVDWPGVSIEIEPLRDYPTGSVTANIIGYLGPISATNVDYYRSLGFDPNRDKIGFAGVEYTFQEELAGSNGRRIVERDVAGKVIRDLAEPISPQPGNNIRLTIDTRLQTAVESILSAEISWWNNHLGETRMTSGSVVVMNPQTGEILAMVSYPSYENNRLTRFIPEYYYEQLTQDARLPLLNHAVGDRLPVGSVFKLATAVGALNERIITPSQIIETPPILYITERYSPNDPGNQRQFVDHNYLRGGFGRLDFIRCISESSNVCFYKVSGGYADEIQEGLGICRIGTYANALGYGQRTSTGLPEETGGLIPDPEYKRIAGGESWTIGDTYIVGVGQGYVLATPLQVLISGSVVAANGKLMEPTILGDILDGEGNVLQPFEPTMRWDITKDPIIKVYEAEYGLRGCSDAETGEYKTVEPWVIERVQEGMRLAVTEGTLSAPVLQYHTMNVAVAGKTGTAEYCDQYALEKGICVFGNWPRHAWTVAYAPYDNPEVAVVAFVYNGGEGSGTAGPIVRRVINAYFQLKAIDHALLAP
jgi:penicillin-binding protein 2